MSSNTCRCIYVETSELTRLPQQMMYSLFTGSLSLISIEFEVVFYLLCVFFVVVWFTSYFSAGFASIYIRMGNGSETAILPAIVVVVVRHCLAESSTVTARRKNMSGPVGKMQCAAATALDIPDISHAQTKTKSYAAFSIKLYFFVFKCTV